MSTTVVIGGGVIGLCCAHELARRGERVVVLEGEKPGAASWASGGWVVPTFSGPLPAPGVIRSGLPSMLRRASPFFLNPMALPELTGWLWSFWRHSNVRDYARGLEAVAAPNRRPMAPYDALQQDGVSFEMHKSGVLFAYLDRTHAAHLLEDLDRLEPLGYRRPEMLVPRDLRDLEPALGPAVVAGLLVEIDRHIRPDTLLDGLRRRLTQLGADLRTGVAVTNVRRRHSGVVAVVTTQGDVGGGRGRPTPSRSPLLLPSFAGRSTSAEPASSAARSTAPLRSPAGSSCRGKTRGRMPIGSKTSRAWPPPT